MNFSDIMAEAVLLTEKSCLVAHVKHFVVVFRVFQIALRALRGGGGLEILLGGIFFTGGELHKEYFRYFEAFVMVKLIFHIY